VLDEVDREALEGVEVDRPVVAERRHDRGQDVAEHASILRRMLTELDARHSPFLTQPDELAELLDSLA
jgi:hypothetical protein